MPQSAGMLWLKQDYSGGFGGPPSLNVEGVVWFRAPPGGEKQRCSACGQNRAKRKPDALRRTRLQEEE